MNVARPLILLMACMLAACAKKETPTPPPPEAGYVVVKAESVPLIIELPGRTNAYETSDVRPQVAGVIKARLFKEGAIVHKGQTLYQIDPSLYRAAVNQAQANVQSAEASRDTAVIKAQRYKPLAAMQAVAAQDYSDAAAAAKQAVAAVAQNKAALDTARINLRFTTVPAPITGRIGRSLFTTGALVTNAQTDPLAQIQRLDPIYVDIQQSSSDLLALRQELRKGGVVPSAATVKLKLEDGSEYGPTGTLEFAEAVVDTNTGAVTLRARFPNPQGLLLPGMFVRAVLSQATTDNGILVPQQAVTRDPQGNASVMLVGSDNKPVSRTVTTSQTVGANWLVTSGLKPGDKVITEGLSKLKPGQAIKPVPAGSKPAPESKNAAKADKSAGHSGG
ncbi:membrane fusion protein (multidrug efflux system) [Sphingomonas vulcanisoli]|uniref:Membrane fusion protein (Multidrug efflux system) n=2 Tax=Sphingomonas vulcanisoli TaxID=1658060 RepID=A0ABX0TYY2_9SPHN|nr:membrane fusion protein (multidrug efflux system) [Sphingomonas vulcanisoli]